jgi:beta-glucosidase
MKYYSSFLLLIGIFTISIPGTSQDENDDKIKAFIGQMTLEEKIGQMTNLGLTAVCKGPFYNDIDSLEIDTVKLKKYLLDYHIGSIQNKGKYPPGIEEWNRIISNIQEYAINQTRLGIPVLFGIDAVHGANYTASSTLFPHQIACAATWDPAFAEKTGEITAYEMRASSLVWNYAPVIDISHQPLWGRIFESYGEDTYLTAQMANAFIKGSQGDDISNDKKVAVCLKHFIGYGNPYNGKDRSTAIISDHDLKQYYLPPFEEAIHAGAKTIMLNSGSVNGIPGHIDYHLITEVLKGELGFEGFVISDWDDLTKLVVVHNVAHNGKEATRMAVMAGMDMCMVPYDESFSVFLAELVKEGQVPLERINDAVRRILKVKFELGLFENPYSNPDAYPLFGSKGFAEESYLAARECITLLKNEKSILPITKSSKILVTGPSSNSINFLNGAWSRTWSGVEEDYNDPDKLSILDAIREKAGEQNVLFTEGTGIDEEINIDSAVELAEESDLIVVCLGEKPATEKPSDIDELDLPDAQLKLVKQLAATGKPVILVLVQGRPRGISAIEGLSQAVVMAYLPGQEGGRAIADVLFGDCNPSGRLPYTYPRYSGSIWKYNHKGADALDINFGLDGFNPLYEFGEGLSYTSFAYSEPQLSADTIFDGDSLHVTVNISNTGDIFGKEVVQLYTRDMVASVSPDMKNLARFTKIALNPGETKTVSFTLNTDDLAFVGADNQWVIEPGEFQVLIGGTPGSLQMKSFYYLQK